LHFKHFIKDGFHPKVKYWTIIGKKSAPLEPFLAVYKPLFETHEHAH